MFYKIENEYYTAEVNSLGAELHSFKSKKTGKEFIWFGKSEIWSGADTFPRSRSGQE